LKHQDSIDSIDCLYLIVMNRKLKKKEERGFLYNENDNNYSYKEKISLLKSEIPKDRTLGAKLLVNHKDENTVDILVRALEFETKLYPKIEICNTLVLIGELSVKPLIDVLGKIGSNQHKSIPEKVFAKDSYPLPRDIAARTLIRFGKNALEELIAILDNGNINQISEAIDAIGYICFYEKSPEIFEKLKSCFLKYSNTELIQWKIVRSMSAFSESRLFLNEQCKVIINRYLLLEIERSLRILELEK
jgi:hypothetical protein